MSLPVDAAPNDLVRADVIVIARAYVQEHHPDARAAILGGSAAAGNATTTSDLDIAVLYPDGHSNYAETIRFRGWLIEAFVHTPASLEFWYQKEAADRRPVIADLCARGVLLTDDDGGAAWQAEAQAQMSRGPEPLTDGERGLRRYGLSALVDDLDGSTNPAETFMLAADVFREAADLLLLENGSWLGGGKWIPRRLALSGDHLAVALNAWAADPQRPVESLSMLARAVLHRSGGYVQEGFLRGER
ncbi:nucleotidyltransferase domain-containing protein [Arthrobacter sp. 35W]|uniref:nucleotidyltransferase domain-containing protein n=1 Tax=Arthrobacter sp. 35W TaxID=1132441 RepID=UPI000420C315|nr:nucleotidyltransferase domain-containing protein [Arthrobacter sp. 35W]